VFGKENYRNEIIWKRTSSHNDASIGFGSVTDTTFFFPKGKSPIWNRLRVPLSSTHVAAKYASVRHCSEKHLHRYLSEYDFRYNARVALGVNDEARAVKAVKGIVGKRLTYRTTGSANAGTQSQA